MASEDGKLRIVLVGDTGSGKSSTGNTILRKRAFTIRQSWESETLTCQAERGEFEGTPVSVVDTPWTIRPNTTEMSKCISYCAPGPHAFLLVIPLETFTEVERQVQNLQRTFGEEASRYTIVLFTHGDELADGVTGEQFIHQNPVPYGLGYHVFNNSDEDPSQVRELLEKIKRMVQRNGGCYCIKAKDWKHKYMYPFASAVTIGGGIGAASGGTGGGAVVACAGSFIGLAAADDGGNIDVAVAVVVAVVVAVAFCSAAYVAGAIGVALYAAVNFVVAITVGVVVSAVAAVGLVSVSVAAAVSVVGYEAGTVSVLSAQVAALSAGLATTVSLVAADGAAVIGFADRLGAGVAIGAGIGAKVAGGIFTGAGTAGAAFEVLDDIDVRVEAIWGIIGGAGVGAGVSAAVVAYADDDVLNAVGAGFTVISVLTVLLIIVCKAPRSISKIGRLAIAGVSAGAVFGAAAGVLGASHFAAHFAGVIITIVCKAVAVGLNRSS